jgi:FkbM family methyltransferase
MPTERDAPPWGTYRPDLLRQAIIALSRHSPLGRGPLRKLSARLFLRRHAGPVDARLWGQKIRLFPARNVSERKALLRPDRMDRSEYAFLHSRLQRPGAVFVDVGANAGLYSLYAALHAAAGARILAIEPDAAILSRFEFNLRLLRAAVGNPRQIEVATAAVAIGDRDGEGLLSTTGDEGSRSLLAGSGRPVTVRRLAALLDEHGIDTISVIKIDVEGYEDRVLPPFLAEAPPRRWPQSIIIEHVHRQRWGVDCIALCQARGYRVSSLTNNNTLLDRVD